MDTIRMLIILPFLGLYLIFQSLFSKSFSDKLLIREKTIYSLIIWSLLFVAITEGLNIFKSINVSWIASSWIIVDLAFVIFLPKKKIKINFPKIDLEEKIMIIAIVAILIVTIILAFAVAPNNIDALSYHLTRVMYWIQNHSINFYPTNISWQINNGQLASFIHLHMYLLSGGDYFANTVQWIFYIGNIISASLIAKEFGGNLKTQITAAFLCATIPMSILQASTVHDVLIVSFFLLTFIYFAFSSISSPKKITLFLTGASLGLSLLTKQIAYIYAFPFFFCFLWLNYRKFKFKKTFYYFSIISITAILINFPFYLRNIEFSGLPIFSIRNDYINSPQGLLALESGVIKNLGVHLSTPSQTINYKIHTLISSLMNTLGVAENSPGFNWVNFPFGIPPSIASEYTAPAVIHLILGAVASLFLFIKIRVKKMLKIYFFCIVFGFLIFAEVFKWQTAASHLENEVFVLFTPLTAIIFTNWKRSIRYFLIFILISSSFYFLFFNIYKPIISEDSIFNLPRTQQYFKMTPELYSPYIEIGKFVQKGKYKNVGVIFKEYYSEMEYPLWVLLKEQRKDIVIEHVEVTNETARLSHGFKPDVVIFLGTDKTVLGKYIEKGIPVIGIK